MESTASSHLSSHVPVTPPFTSWINLIWSIHSIESYRSCMSHNWESSLRKFIISWVLNYCLFNFELQGVTIDEVFETRFFWIFLEWILNDFGYQEVGDGRADQEKWRSYSPNWLHFNYFLKKPTVYIHGENICFLDKNGFL